MLNLCIRIILSIDLGYIHKSDKNSDKDLCGVAKNFLTKCKDVGKTQNIEIIEQVERGSCNVEGKLLCRVRILSYSMNSMNYL